MSTPRLSTTSYVVLGMIALRGPSTPYDLKRAIGHSVGYFWQFPHAQMYSEPQRLAQAGLLDVVVEKTGRRRKTYAITERGREKLRQWVADPTAEHFQLRDVAELKLFFSELTTSEDVVALAREQVRQHEERLASYEAIRRRFADRPEIARRMAPLRLGIELEQTALRFWRSLIEDPPD